MFGGDVEEVVETGETGFVRLAEGSVDPGRDAAFGRQGAAVAVVRFGGVDDEGVESLLCAMADEVGNLLEGRLIDEGPGGVAVQPERLAVAVDEVAFLRMDGEGTSVGASCYRPFV